MTFRFFVGIVFAIGVAGCYEQIYIDDPDGSPPPWDGSLDAGIDGGFMLPEGKCEEASGVDLLLVIDNSNSMTEEQASLAEQLPNFIRSLVSPPDTDLDGEPDWQPVTDLHVGVITTDMGSFGFGVPTCGSGTLGNDFGDDGLLRTVGNTAVPGCMATYPSILAFDPGATSPDDFAFDVACVAQLGTGGCGFEQQLEATLKALSPTRATAYTGPSYEPPQFFMNSASHGDRENAGFVRDDTLLAVIIVTDEEDCSASDEQLMNPSGGPYNGTDLNLRCFAFPEAVHPIERYVDGLIALRRNRMDLLAFGLIVGIPPDLAVPRTQLADFDRMLDDPRLEERVDPEMMNRLVPSCEVPGRGHAFPPRRLIRVARAIGPGRANVQSICQESFQPAAAALAGLVGSRACQRFEE